MADKLMRAIVSIPSDTGLPEDAVVNVWHFDGDDQALATDADYHAGVMTLLTAFYGAADAYISSLMASPATVKIYDMRDATPRVPEYTGTIALTFGAAASYPSEVAVCLSFYAQQTSGVNQARRRGRVYIGPANADTGALISNGWRVSAAARTAICAAAATMKAGAPAGSSGASVKWAVYSPTTDAEGANLDDSFHDVVGGWMDDAFDTQRRRGVGATTRTLF